MKKLFTILTAVLIGACSLTGCAANLVPPIDDTLDGNSIVTMTKSDLITVSAVSVGNIMIGIDSSASGVTASAFVNSNIDSSRLVDKINYYMSVVENLIDNNTTSIFEESDIAEYDYKKVITTTSFGENIQYVLYYNETLIGDEKDDEVDADDDDDEEIERTAAALDKNIVMEKSEEIAEYTTDEINSDKTEEEQEFRMSGIMVIGDKIYEFQGEREVEQDEIEFEFVAKIDADNYVRFSQEIEGEEQEFQYSIYEGGQKIKSFSLQIEKENDKTEVCLKEKSAESNLSVKYEKKVDKNSDEYIEIKVDDNGEVIKCEARIQYDTQTGDKSIIYDFEDGNKFEKQPYGKDEEDIKKAVYPMSA
ncbi:MAG: hypothetical protein ACI4MI_05780 [Christensenellales bacterium]